jgi:hypothetical protein
MLLRIAYIFLILGSHSGFAYYTLYATNNLYIKFIFFLSSVLLICLFILKGNKYIFGDDFENTEQPTPRKFNNETEFN